jgi:two-component system phosphate regulon response regulator PhoB
LLVDGSAEDCCWISRQLRESGHETVCAGNFAEALRLAEHSAFDAVITEWVLTDANGLDVAEFLRGNPRTAGARILIVSHRDEPRDIAAALDLGVDDYLVKPVKAEEFIARLNAVLRRPNSVPLREVLQIGPLRLDRISHRVTVDAAEIELAPVEFRLLSFLMENRGRVIGRKQLLTRVWNRRKGIGERTVDVHVRRLRAALTPHGCADLLQTVRGFGYRLD